jgi:HSP20 family protein
MSFWEKDIDDWFRRFAMVPRRSRTMGSGDMFREFEEMHREMERMFEEQLQNIQTKAPKELIREYQSPDGAKVREIGPLVYGYSVTIGPDGKPKVREFGNVKSLGRMIDSNIEPRQTAEREPLADIVTTDKEVKVIVEMPGIRKEDVKVNTYDNKIEITTTDSAERKYFKVLELPPDADTETARSSYKNGILEILFDKKATSKSKGKEVRVD